MLFGSKGKVASHLSSYIVKYSYKLMSVQSRTLTMYTKL